MTNKIKTGTMLYPETIILIDDNQSLANVSSRNQFIEDAIKFYVAYLSKDNNINYLNKHINEVLKNRIDLLEDHLATILFKLSVEVNVLTQIISTTTDIDVNTLKQIRKKSIDEVKRTVGKIDLEEIFRIYSMKEGN